MGSKNPERDRLWASDSDKLGAYSKHYSLTARCSRCNHEREMPIAFLLKAFKPGVRLDQVASRLRCSSCGLLGAKFAARYKGPRGDPRR